MNSSQKIIKLVLISAVTMAFPVVTEGGVNPQGQSHLQYDFNRAAEGVKPCVVGVTAFKNFHNGTIPTLPQGIFFADPFVQNVPSLPWQQKIGSGIIIDSRGYILTNLHVIKQAKDIHVTLTGLNPMKSKFHQARVVKIDINMDLALLKIIPDEPLPVAKLGNSETVRLGDWVMAIGSTFGFEQTITAGIVSAKDRILNIDGIVYRGLIQTDASINQGNSGGPLVNMNGEVIGINTAIYAPNGTFTGVGFAIPINQAKSFLNQNIPVALVAQQATNNYSPVALGWGVGQPCPYCGVALDSRGVCPLPRCPWNFRSSPQQVALPCPGACPGCPLGTPQIPSQQVAMPCPGACPGCPLGTPQTSPQPVLFNPAPGVMDSPATNQVIFVAGKSVNSSWLGVSLLPRQNGLQVVEVIMDSPAERGGVKLGDIIVQLNGKVIETITDFDNTMDKIRPGKKIKLVVIRQGKKRALYLRTGKSHPLP